MSNNNPFCNLMVEEADLKKLQDLDPFQTDGFQSNAKIQTNVTINFTDELGKTISDTQLLTFQILTRWVRNVQKHKQQPALQSLRVIVTSQEDIFFAFMCNCSALAFESIKAKNQLNLHFNDFPTNLMKLLHGGPTQKTEVQLRLNHQGTGRLFIFEQTDYKRLELVELFLQSCNIEKAHQSIIYRYNFNRTKLAMLENSIETVYKILAQKMHLCCITFKKNVGIEQ